jgi:Zn finger protein HypA/HybF involved in hydrogenase expression
MPMLLAAYCQTCQTPVAVSDHSPATSCPACGSESVRIDGDAA